MPIGSVVAQPGQAVVQAGATAAPGVVGGRVCAGPAAPPHPFGKNPELTSAKPTDSRGGVAAPAGAGGATAAPVSVPVATGPVSIPRCRGPNAPPHPFGKNPPLTAAGAKPSDSSKSTLMYDPKAYPDLAKSMAGGGPKPPMPGRGAAPGRGMPRPGGGRGRAKGP